jgi:hypothetical protein
MQFFMRRDRGLTLDCGVPFLQEKLAIPKKIFYGYPKKKILARIGFGQFAKRHA